MHIVEIYKKPSRTKLQVSLVHKVVDPDNGTVQVSTYGVERGVWSRLICRTIEVLKKHLAAALVL